MELTILYAFWYSYQCHETGEKLLEGMAVTSLITLLVAINILRPGFLSLSALVACTILVALVVRRLSASPNPFRSALPSSAPSMPHNWMRPTEDSDKLTDKLVSVVQEIIKNMREGEKASDDDKMRQALHGRLGQVIREAIGLPVGGQIIGV